MKYYREGVPEAESPCARPAIEPVGWCVGYWWCENNAVGFRGVVVWKTYAQSARDLGARKLGVLDPSTLVVRRLKEVA